MRSVFALAGALALPGIVGAAGNIRLGPTCECPLQSTVTVTKGCDVNGTKVPPASFAAVSSVDAPINTTELMVHTVTDVVTVVKASTTVPHSDNIGGSAYVFSVSSGITVWAGPTPPLSGLFTTVVKTVTVYPSDHFSHPNSNGLDSAMTLTSDKISSNTLTTTEYVTIFSTKTVTISGKTHQSLVPIMTSYASAFSPLTFSMVNKQPQGSNASTVTVSNRTIPHSSLKVTFSVTNPSTKTSAFEIPSTTVMSGNWSYAPSYHHSKPKEHGHKSRNYSTIQGSDVTTTVYARTTTLNITVFGTSAAATQLSSAHDYSLTLSRSRNCTRTTSTNQGTLTSYTNSFNHTLSVLSKTSPRAYLGNPREHDPKHSLTSFTLGPGVDSSTFSLLSINTSTWATSFSAELDTAWPTSQELPASATPSKSFMPTASVSTSNFSLLSIDTSSCPTSFSTATYHWHEHKIGPVFAKRSGDSSDDMVYATIDGQRVSWTNNYTPSASVESATPPAAAVTVQSPLPAFSASVPLGPGPFVSHAATSYTFITVSGDSVLSHTAAPSGTSSHAPGALSATFTESSPSLLATQTLETSGMIYPTHTLQPDCPGTELGNFVIGFDDLPTYGEPAHKNEYPPIVNPYRHLFWSEGFSYVPPPADPYLPHSGHQLGAFIVDGNANVHSLNYTGPIPSVDDVNGMFGSGPNYAQSAYWINAHSAWVGCQLLHEGACSFSVHGWKLDKATGQSVKSVHQHFNLTACGINQTCPLQEIKFDSQFNNLTALQLVAHVPDSRLPVSWYVDDLNLTWSNDTCAAAHMRAHSV